MILMVVKRHDASDIEAVISTLTSDWLTQGPVVDDFENSVAQYCGAGGGVTFNSATSALLRSLPCSRRATRRLCLDRPKYICSERKLRSLLRC